MGCKFSNLTLYDFHLDGSHIFSINPDDDSNRYVGCLLGYYLDARIARPSNCVGMNSFSYRLLMGMTLPEREPKKLMLLDEGSRANIHLIIQVMDITNPALRY